jgi:hypothetical protein
VAGTVAGHARAHVRSDVEVECLRFRKMPSLSSLYYSLHLTSVIGHTTSESTVAPAGQASGAESAVVTPVILTVHVNADAPLPHRGGEGDAF